MVMDWLIFIGFAALIGLLIWLYFWWDRKQTEKWATFAKQRGWRFTDKDSNGRPQRYRDFQPFGQGRSRHARWVLSGRLGNTPFEIFHYHYEITSGSGKHRSTTHYWFKICTLEMPIDAPGLVIKDEHLGHKLFDAVGGEDIDMEHDAFSRKFWVKCEDRKFAYDVLHAPMIEFLLPMEGWSWEWRERTLMLTEEGKFEPERCDELLELVSGFRERLPRHLLAEMDG